MEKTIRLVDNESLELRKRMNELTIYYILIIC